MKNIIDDNKIIIKEKEFKTGDEVSLNVIRYDWLHGIISKIDKEKKTVELSERNSVTTLSINHITEAC